MRISLGRKWLLLAAAVALLGAAAGVWVLLHPASFVVQPWRAQQSVTAARFMFGPYPVDADMVRLKATGVTTIISLLNPSLPYESVLLDQEKARAQRLGIRVLNFPMGSILGQRFGADYERNSRAAAEAAIASDGTVYIHCYLGLHRARSVRDYLEQHAGQADTRQFHGSIAHNRSPRQLANERAQGLFEQEDYEGALRELGSVQPPDYAAYVLTGWIELRRNDNALARDQFRQATGMPDAKADSWDGLGFALLRLDDLDGAGSAFGQALTLAPQDNDAMQGMAQTLYRQNKPAQARPLLEQLHADDPDNPEVKQLLERVKEQASSSP